MDPLAKEASREALKCANCGGEGHLASYRGCPYLKLVFTAKKEKIVSRDAANQRWINGIASAINPNISYAQATEPLPAQQQTSRTSLPTAAAPRASRPAPRHQREAGNDDNYSDYPFLSDQNTSKQTPDWLSELKSEISSLVSEQLVSIASQVAKNASKIDFIAIDVNSIIRNYCRLEFCNFVDTYKHDIVLISETKLNAKYKIHIGDYYIIRTDQITAGRGVP